MAKAYKCEMCGEFYEAYSNGHGGKSTKCISFDYRDSNGVLHVGYDSKDVCPECHKKASDMFAGKKEQGLKVRIKYFDPACKIEKIEKGDWIDLRAADSTTLIPGKFAKIRLGVAMELPDGYEAHIVPRSSSFKNWGILETNSMGIIDNSYSGDHDEWSLPVYCTKYAQINKGDRVCQFRIVEKQPEIEFEEVEILGNADRGGFGSTGVK